MISTALPVLTKPRSTYRRLWSAIDGEGKKEQVRTRPVAIVPRPGIWVISKDEYG